MGGKREQNSGDRKYTEKNRCLCLFVASTLLQAFIALFPVTAEEAEYFSLHSPLPAPYPFFVLP